jgi:hypothetical protein
MQQRTIWKLAAFEEGKHIEALCHDPFHTFWRDDGVAHPATIQRAVACRFCLKHPPRTKSHCPGTFNAGACPHPPKLSSSHSRHFGRQLNAKGLHHGQGGI